MEAIQETSPAPRDWRARWEMPVLMKEMRSRMRGNRMPVLLGVTAATSVVVGLFLLFIKLHETTYQSGNPQQAMSTVGHALFATLVVTQAILCVLIAPALTAGSISGEGEQQCLEMLLLSRLSTWNIVTSKLLSALGILLLMLLCTMPVMAICFLLGGVSIREVLLSYALVLVVGIYGGAVGLYYSARMRKTTHAVIMAYLVSLLWCTGIPAIGFGISALGSALGNSSERDAIIYCGINLLIMLFPTLLISAIYNVRTRRAMRWWVALIIWLVLSTAMCICYACNSSAFPEAVVLQSIGSPSMSILVQVIDPSIPSNFNALERWCGVHLTELSLPILLAFAWAYLTFTTQCLREMRKPVQ